MLKRVRGGRPSPPPSPAKICGPAAVRGPSLRGVPVFQAVKQTQTRRYTPRLGRGSVGEGFPFLEPHRL
jgi:hypothetical protein